MQGVARASEKALAQKQWVSMKRTIGINGGTMRRTMETAKNTARRLHDARSPSTYTGGVGAPGKKVLKKYRRFTGRGFAQDTGKAVEKTTEKGANPEQANNRAGNRQ
jgi:hypothetical protein